VQIEAMLSNWTLALGRGGIVNDARHGAGQSVNEDLMGNDIGRAKCEFFVYLFGFLWQISLKERHETIGCAESFTRTVCRGVRTSR
jgi:hypothetical protein